MTETLDTLIQIRIQQKIDAMRSLMETGIEFKTKQEYVAFDLAGIRRMCYEQNLRSRPYLQYYISGVRTTDQSV